MHYAKTASREWDAYEDQCEVDEIKLLLVKVILLLLLFGITKTKLMLFTVTHMKRRQVSFGDIKCLILLCVLGIWMSMNKIMRKIVSSLLKKKMYWTSIIFESSFVSTLKTILQFVYLHDITDIYALY